MGTRVLFDLKMSTGLRLGTWPQCIAGSSRSLQTSGPLISNRRKLTKMYFLLGWNACIWPGLRFAFEASPNMGSTTIVHFAEPLSVLFGRKSDLLQERSS